MTTKLAVRMLRHRPGSALATLVALAVGVLILVALGTLVESGLRYTPTPQRYAAADIVLAHPTTTVTSEDFTGETTTSTVPLPEGGTVPADLVAQVRRLPGVATAVGDDTLPVVAGGTPVVGRPWSAAVLSRYRLAAGSAPRVDDEVVVDARLGMRPGELTTLIVGGVSGRYRVSGVADAPAVFFTDVRAAALTPHPGRVTAIGVLATPDADRDALVAALTRLATPAGGTVYTGDDRGLAEQSDTLVARDLLIQAGGAFGGYVVLLVVFVVAGTLGLSVRHRRRDIALLRAVAATPGQVRRMLLMEAVLLGVAAAVVGVPGGVLATGWVHDQLVARGFVPASFPIVPGVLSAVAATVLTTLVAVLAALIAARRATAVRPTEALGEAAVEPPRPGRVRLVCGLVALGVAGASSVLTLGTSGQTAQAGAIGMLYLFVLAVALLAPWINRAAARILAPLLGAVWGASGYLATANLRANARGGAGVLTALVLAVGFGGSVWFLQDNLERATLTQSRDGLLAQHALVSPAGLPDRAAEELRAVPGVRAATGVRHTSVLVPLLDGVEPAAAQAVDASGTVDLAVREGNLDDLGEGTVAVSDVRADTQGWELGDRVAFRLGDGTPVTLRVIAVYQRGLGFGDVTLSRETVAGHTATGLVDEVLIRADPGTDLDAVAARYPGARLVSADALTGRIATDLAIGAWLNKLLIGVMVGYSALAAANTMVLAALARRRELAQLRLVGVTRRQVKRMVHAEQAGLLGVALVIGGAIAAATLTAVVMSLTGEPVPYVPPLGWVVVLGGTAVLALTTTVLPIGRLLRTPPIEQIALKE
ncbi:FtsX-like permease family protein [Cryptosporangium minutisporangium]|uniref:ABC transporter permease n=1 Tax=Cryptosporangium minutisporangium TaxID=113569 RepID=A0ABP6SRA0_9ACTN